MRTVYPLFQSHLDLAHRYWERLVTTGDCAIDATCGNGHDTLLLARLIVRENQGKVIGLDVQSEAIENTHRLLKAHLSAQQLARVELLQLSHAHLSKEMALMSIRLIVYNLGYLPGGNKAITSQVSTTLASLHEALKIVADGGAISITCYLGHPEGLLEEKAILEMAHSLDPTLWSCCHHRWLNRNHSPSLLLIQKGMEK